MARDEWKWDKMSKIQEAFGSVGCKSCTPCFFSCTSVGAPAASDSKHHKNAKDHTDDIMSVNFIHLAYIISQFGIERCKIRYFMDHFSQSLESNREQPLHNTVNV